MKYITQKKLKTASLKEVGGKAKQLGILAENLPVPPFVVFPSSTKFQKLKESSVHGFVDSSKKYSVRSSANVEDSESASYAGLFDTKLNILGTDVLTAIQEVSESSNSERVRSYAAAENDEIKVAVIVQEMVDASVSGVALGRGKNDNEILIEAIYGLGELLVGGTVSPDHWRLNRSDGSILESWCGRKEIMLLSSGVEFTPAYERALPTLNENQLSKVRNALEAVEKLLKLESGDMEFAFSGDEFFVLQGRPLVSRAL